MGTYHGFMLSLDDYVRTRDMKPWWMPGSCMVGDSPPQIHPEAKLDDFKRLESAGR